MTVAGLKKIKVTSPDHILELLREGNNRRKTESTDANGASSRSHAVLEICVRRSQKNQYVAQILKGKLALVDLAGSERASDTNNTGHKLRDGANINRSLLALANCINALGKQHKRGIAYVPYRNSKLTRLLKDGLSGNSRTTMVATVSCDSDQYQHTTNTLKYADRAKEIKTHIQTNVGTVESHVAEYQAMIDNLQTEVKQLKYELSAKNVNNVSSRQSESDDSERSFLDLLSNEINENIEERINLQKALFELEDINVQNRYELHHVDEQLEAMKELSEDDKTKAGSVYSQLNDRRQLVLESVRDNEESGLRYRAEIESNEASRRQLQEKIDSAIRSDRNAGFLRILSQYRLQSVMNMEMQFQMAVRDQIISDQREVISNLWKVLACSGLDRNRILEIAAQQGILMDPGGSVIKSSNGTADRKEAVVADGGRPETNDVSGSGQEASPSDTMDRDKNDGAAGTGGRGDKGESTGRTSAGSPTTPMPPQNLQHQSISGARAQYRYNFWQQYDSSAIGWEKQTLSEPANVPLRSNGKSGKAPPSHHRSGSMDDDASSHSQSSGENHHHHHGGAGGPTASAGESMRVDGSSGHHAHVESSVVLRGRPLEEKTNGAHENVGRGVHQMRSYNPSELSMIEEKSPMVRSTGNGGAGALASASGSSNAANDEKSTASSKRSVGGGGAGLIKREPRKSSGRAGNKRAGGGAKGVSGADLSVESTSALSANVKAAYEAPQGNLRVGLAGLKRNRRHSASGGLAAPLTISGEGASAAAAHSVG